jgi:hypothetical protein
MPDKYRPPYTFSTHIDAACAQQMKTFADLAETYRVEKQSDQSQQRRG